MTEQVDVSLSTPHITLWHGDCLEEMKRIPDKSIDMILCDWLENRAKIDIEQDKWDEIKGRIHEYF